MLYRFKAPTTVIFFPQFQQQCYQAPQSIDLLPIFLYLKRNEAKNQDAHSLCTWKQEAESCQLESKVIQIASLQTARTVEPDCPNNYLIS